MGNLLPIYHCYSNLLQYIHFKTNHKPYSQLARVAILYRISDGRACCVVCCNEMEAKSMRNIILLVLCFTVVIQSGCAFKDIDKRIFVIAIGVDQSDDVKIHIA